MSARIIVYTFELLDRFSPNAAKMADAAKRTEQLVNSLGRSFNQMEGRGAAFALAERRRLEELTRARTEHFEKAQRQLDQYQQRQHRAAALMGTTTTAVLTAGLGSSVMRQFDQFISKAADLQTARQKLFFATGGDQSLVDAATNKSFDLSKKYKNVSAVEAMHIIDDLRANLPEEFGHVIESATEPFVRLHGFFKAWNGGKHSGHAEAAMRDIGAAIRAGELTGMMSGDLLSKHVQNLAMARIQFGDKFKVQEYFQSVQKAATALASADQTFNYADFPVLVQRLNQGGGVALATLYQKLVGGTRMTQGTLAAWDKLGLVDRNVVKYDKKGYIDPKSVVGKKWLKDANDYGTNVTDALMTKVVPALSSKGGMEWLQGDKLAQYWKEKNVSGIVHIMEEIRKDPNKMTELSRAFTALGYDRNAAKAMEELVLGSGSVLRDRIGIQTVLQDIENYKSYDKSKQTFNAQWRNLVATLGGPLVEFASKRLERLAGIMERITDWARANPKLASAATNIGMIGAGTALSVAGLGGAILALKALSALMGASGGALKLLMGGGLIGGLAYGLYALRDQMSAAKAMIVDGLGGAGGGVFDAVAERWKLLGERLSKVMQESISEALTGSKLIDDGRIDGAFDDMFTRIARRMSERLRRPDMSQHEGGWHRAQAKPGDFETDLEAMMEWGKYYGATVLADMSKIWNDMVAGARAAWGEIKKIFDFKDLFNFEFGDFSKGALEKKLREWMNKGQSPDSLYGPEKSSWFQRDFAPAHLQPGYWGRFRIPYPIPGMVSSLPEEEMARERARGGWRGGLPSSEAQREVSIRSHVEVNGGVEVKVDATGLGRGFAAIRGVAHSRGESAPVVRGSGRDVD